MFYNNWLRFIVFAIREPLRIFFFPIFSCNYTSDTVKSRICLLSGVVSSQADRSHTVRRVFLVLSRGNSCTLAPGQQESVIIERPIMNLWLGVEVERRKYCFYFIAKGTDAETKHHGRVDGIQLVKIFVSILKAEQGFQISVS